MTHPGRADTTRRRCLEGVEGEVQGGPGGGDLPFVSSRAVFTEVKRQPVVNDERDGFAADRVCQAHLAHRRCPLEDEVEFAGQRRVPNCGHVGQA